MLKKFNQLYYFTFLSLGIISFIISLKQFPTSLILSSKTIKGIGILIFLFLISHFMRFFRLYVTLIEHKVPISKLCSIYFLTSWVGFSLPFKAGELFKICEISRIVKSKSLGIASVVICRMFDAFLIIAAIIIAQIFGGIKSIVGLKFLALTLTVFLLFALFSYITFPSLHAYFARLALTASQSKKGLVLARILYLLESLYLKVTSLIRGRVLVLLAISTLIWLIEFIVVFWVSDFFFLSSGKVEDLLLVYGSIFKTGAVPANSNIGFILFANLILLTVLGFISLVHLKKTSSQATPQDVKYKLSSCAHIKFIERPIHE